MTDERTAPESDVQEWLRGYDDPPPAPPPRAPTEAEQRQDDFDRWIRGVAGRTPKPRPTPPPTPLDWAGEPIGSPFAYPDTPDGRTERYLALALPEATSAAARVRGALRDTAAETPLQGLTAGEIAQFHVRAMAVEAEEMRLVNPGSGVDTELRETLDKIKGLEAFTERASILRAAQRIGALGKHRVKVCLRYMTERGPTENGERVVEVVQGMQRIAGNGGEGPRYYPSSCGADLAPPEPAVMDLGLLEPRGAPRYRGVALCGNGWVCPVCASRVTETRREQLAAGVGAWRQGKLPEVDPDWPEGRPGGAVLLMTFTFSHGRNDELKPAWDSLGRALQRFARDPVVKSFRAAVGWIGRIRSREITYGVNGWHPHAHTLELIDGAAADPEAIDHWQAELKKTWSRCCDVVGLSASLEHGFTMSLTDVDTYIAKWGIDAEMTKWHLKKRRPTPDAPAELALNGYSPFDLLRIHAGELDAHPLLKLTTDRAAALFAEYARACKGTAQLHWTRGLRATLGVDDVSDAEAAAADKPDEIVLGTLRPSDWFVIVSGNHQIEFLGLVAVKGWAFASTFLERWRTQLEHFRSRGIQNAFRNRGVAYLFEAGKRKRNGPKTESVGHRSSGRGAAARRDKAA